MNDDLQSFIEPELEARLVALILGEASAFEVEELDRILKKRPEVALAKQRLEEAHGLLGQAMAKADDDDEWKLSTDRREKVLAVFGEGSSAPDESSQLKERRISIAQWRSIYATAACLMVAVVVLALVAPMTDPNLKEDVAMVPFSSESRYTEEDIREQEDLVQDYRKALTVVVQDYGIPYFDGGEYLVGQSEEQMYRRAQEKLDELEQSRDHLQVQLRKLSDSPNDDLVRTAAGLELPENKATRHYTASRAAEEKANALVAGKLGANHPDVRAAKLKAKTELASAAKEVESLKEVLETRLSLVDKQVGKMKEMVREKKDGTVDLSMRQHQFNSAKEEYEQSRNKLREMKLERGLDESNLSAVALQEESTPAIDEGKTARDYLAEIEVNSGETPGRGESASKPVGYESLSTENEFNYLGLRLHSNSGTKRSDIGRESTKDISSRSGEDVPWDLELTAKLESENESESVFGFDGIPKGEVKFNWAVSSQSFSGGTKGSDDRLWYNFSDEAPKNWSEHIDGGRGFVEKKSSESQAKGGSEGWAGKVTAVNGRVTEELAQNEEAWKTLDDLPSTGRMFKFRSLETKDENGESTELRFERTSGALADKLEADPQRASRVSKPQAPKRPSSSLARVIPDESKPTSNSKAAASIATAGALVIPELPSEPRVAKPDLDADGFSTGFSGVGGGGASGKKRAEKFNLPAFPVTPATPTSFENDSFALGDGDQSLSNSVRGQFFADGAIESKKKSKRETAAMNGKNLSGPVQVVDDGVFLGEGIVEKGKASAKPVESYRAKQLVTGYLASGNEGGVERLANKRDGGLSKDLNEFLSKKSSKTKMRNVDPWPWILAMSNLMKRSRNREKCQPRVVPIETMLISSRREIARRFRGFLHRKIKRFLELPRLVFEVERRLFLETRLMRCCQLPLRRQLLSL